MNYNLLSLLLPLLTLVLYLHSGSFLMRSSTTLLCLVIVLMLWWRNSHNKLCALNPKHLLWIVAAFALSFAGDYVLGHWGGGFGGFVAGVGLFLIAHLAYMAYSLSQGRFVRWLLLLLLLGFGIYYVLLLRPAIGDSVTRAAILAYILVSCLSMSAAAGIWTDLPQSVDRCPLSVVRCLYILGIASLLFSDFLIAQKRFLHEGSLYFLMMPTYFASQILVTASLLWRFGKPRNDVSHFRQMPTDKL